VTRRDTVSVGCNQKNAGHSLIRAQHNLINLAVYVNGQKRSKQNGKKTRQVTLQKWCVTLCTVGDSPQKHRKMAFSIQTSLARGMTRPSSSLHTVRVASLLKQCSVILMNQPSLTLRDGISSWNTWSMTYTASAVWYTQCQTTRE
jgi:hypothetical protein